MGCAVPRNWLIRLAVGLMVAVLAAGIVLAWGYPFSSRGGSVSSVTLPASGGGSPGSQPQVTSQRSGSDPVPGGGSDSAKGFSQWLDEGAVRATTRAQWATIARQNAVVVLNSWDYRLIPVLKAANPAVRVYVYKNLSGVRSDDCTTASGSCGSCPPGVHDSAYLSSGMGYCWLERHHPQWILRDASGQPLQYRGYPRIWETNYGNHAYLRQWLHNVIADVRAHGWNGVEVDNALTTANAYGVAAKYPTDAAVQAATYSALRYLGPQLSLYGIGSVFNVGYAPRFPGLWQRWLGPVGGLKQEFYLSSSAQPGATGHLWREYEAEVSACAAQHKSCFFHSGDYATAITPAAREYALASFLLATDGHQLLATGSTPSPTLTGCRALGAPAGPMIATGSVLSRRFTGGIVVVNPSGTTAAVTMSRAYYKGGRLASSVMLAPRSAAILGLGRDAAACS